MQRLTRTIALVLLAISLGSLDAVVWLVLRLPPVLNSINLEVDHALVPWHILIRGLITLILAWLFFYFRGHCVVANREESTRIVTKA